MNETVFALNVLETGSTVGSESCEKWEYCILSTDLAPPTLRRLHSVISDLRPPSVTESGEAALRRLPASRAIGGHSLTSGDPARGSLTAFQSNASCSTTGCLKSSQLCVNAEHLSSFFVWIRTSSVCFVLFLRLRTWRHDWDWPAVTLTQFSSTAGVTAWVLSMTLLRLVPSGLLKRLLKNMLSSFLSPRRLVLRGSSLMRVQATDIF